MKYVLTFVALAALMMGCAITDYPYVRDNSFAHIWQNELVNGDILVWTGSEVITYNVPDDESVFHWTTNYTTLKQEITDEENILTITNWGTFKPMFMGPYFFHYNTLRLPMKKELTYMNEYEITRGTDIIKREYPRMCKVTLDRVKINNVFQDPWGTFPPFTTGVFILDGPTDECRYPASTISVMVSYFGHTFEVANMKYPKGYVDTVNSRKLNAYEKVEMLNELTTQAIVKDGMYHYVVDGNDMSIQILTDSKIHKIDCSEASFPIAIDQELKRFQADFSQSVNIASVLNQVADVADQVSSEPVNLQVTWKGISKTYTVGLLSPDHYRNMADNFAKALPQVR